MLVKSDMEKHELHHDRQFDHQIESNTKIRKLNDSTRSEIDIICVNEIATRERPFF